MEKKKICPKCKREVIKIGFNWMIAGMPIMSHSFECDNKYLE